MRQVALALIAVAWLAASVMAQTVSPPATPLQIEREPTPKPTKNPHAMHHHFDVRHPHKSTRPKLENPQTKPD